MLSTSIALGLVISAGTSECHGPLNVADLCQFVADETAEPDASKRTSLVYETKIHEAACVADTDSPDQVRAKIQAFWKEHGHQLVCNVLNSGVRNGHILKLAVNRSSTRFIKDAARKWKVDLNHVDADGKTVLDYVEEEIAASKGTSRESTLKTYLQVFRASGAKYKKEL